MKEQINARAGVKPRPTREESRLDGPVRDNPAVRRAAAWQQKRPVAPRKRRDYTWMTGVAIAAIVIAVIVAVQIWHHPFS